MTTIDIQETVRESAKYWLRVFIASLALVGSSGVQAGFEGSYAPSNWTTNLNGGCGIVDTSGAPASVVLTSNDCGGSNLFTDYTIASVGTGIWSFDYLFQNLDVDDCCEQAGYLLNGSFTVLGTSGSTSGFVSISVNLGDIIGYRANATDGGFGPSQLTISNFGAPTAVPEPATLALVGFSLAGLGFIRRKKLH